MATITEKHNKRDFKKQPKRITQIKLLYNCKQYVTEWHCNSNANCIRNNSGQWKVHMNFRGG